MRNLRKYFAVLVAIAMMISAMAPAFAATGSYSEEATTLNELGLYKGIDPNSFNADLTSSVNRETAVVLLLRMFGKGAEAKADQAATEEAKAALAAKFSDAANISGWAVNAVAYAVEKGYVQGYNGKFDPKGLLVGKAYSKLVLSLLGYVQGTDFEYDAAGEFFAIEVADTEDGEDVAFNTGAAITKNTMIGISFRALTAMFNNSDETVIEMLVNNNVVTEEVAQEVSDSQDWGFEFAEEVEPTVAPTVAPTAEATVAPSEEATVTPSEEATATPVPAGTATELKEVKVTAQDTFLAVFNGTFADTSKVTFEISGAMTVTPTVTWNEAKTEATIKAQSIMLDGTYTVKATAEGLVADKTSAVVIVAKNGVAKIEILGDKLIRTSASDSRGTGFFYVKLTDTYGTDVTKKMAYDVEISFSKDVAGGELSIDPDTGKVEVELNDDAGGVDEDEKWDDYPAVPEIVSVTMYSNTVTSGGVATASKVLTVTEQSRVETIELGAVTFPSSSTTKILTEKNEAAHVAIVAKDQFGFEVTDKDRLKDSDTEAATDTEVVYSKSDGDLSIEADEYTDANGVEKARLVISTDGTGLTDAIDEAKKVTLTAISKFKGKVSNSIILDIKEPRSVEKVVLGNPEQVVAEGDTYDETLVVPFTAYDESGTQLTVDEVIAAYNAGNIAPEITGVERVVVATSGANKGKIVSNMFADNEAVGEAAEAIAEGTKTLVVDIETSNTMPTVTKIITIKARAYATSIELKATPAAKLLAGAETKYGYKFYDQYGRLMDDEMLDYDPAGADLPTKVKLEATFPTDSDAEFTIVNGGANTSLTDGGTEEVTVYAYNLDASTDIVFTAGDDDGKVSLEATLYKEYDTDSEVDSDKRSFDILEGMPTDLTYSIENVPTLYAYDDATDMDNADADTMPSEIDATEFAALSATEAAHARALKLVARDASGTTYAIPQANILEVRSSDEEVAYALKVGNATLEAHDNTVVVFGNDKAFDDDGAASTATKTATITLLVSTDEGAVEVTKTVTVSNEAKKATKVVFADTALEADDVYALDSDAEVHTDLAGTVAQLAAQDIYVFEVDQFGVYTTVTPATLKVVNTNKYNGTTVALDGNNFDTDDFTAAKIKADEKVYLMYTAASGVYGQISVNANDGAY